jgi:GTPase SAR1 family protein
MGNITRKDISNYLTNVLERDEPAVIALKGKWGVGKTFFIRKFLDDNFPDKYVYVSLFGKSSIEEVIKEIVLQLYRGARFVNKLKGLLGLAEDSVAYETQYKGISLNLTTSLINSLLTLAERRDFKGIIVVLDDIERTAVDIDKVLGLVNSLREEKKCKVILIYNEDELIRLTESKKDKDNNEKYRIYKEKSVDIEINFSPSFSENLEILEKMIPLGTKNAKKEDWEFPLDLIREFFGSIHEEVNLRILHYIYMKLRELDFINSLGISSYFKRTIFNTMLFLFYIKKEPSLAISTKKELKNYLREQKNNKALLEKLEKLEKFKRIIPKDNFLYMNEQFVEELLRFWEYEILPQSLKEAIENSISSYWEKVKSIENLEKKRQFILNAYKNYLAHLSDTKESFVKRVWTFLEKNREELLRIVGIDQYFSLLGKLIEYDKENQIRYQKFALKLFEDFLEEKAEEDSEFLFIPDNSELNYLLNRLVSLGISEDRVKDVISKEITKLFNKFYSGSCTELITNVKHIINKMGWNYSELKIVNSLPKNLLKNCFIETGDLSLVIDFFTKRAHNKFFAELGKTLLQVLNELERDERFKGKIYELKAVLEKHIEKFRKQLEGS